MDNRKFFRIIWRINAILMLLALGLVIFQSASELYGQLRPQGPGLSNFATYEVDESGEVVTETRWRYGGLEEIPGTHVFAIPLRAVGDRNQTRNLLFVDTELGSKWLLPHNTNIIWQYESLSEGNRALAIVYDISECTNNACSEWSERAIYLSRPDGSELTKVVDAVSRRIEQATIDEDHMLVFYVKEGVALVAKVSLTDFTVVESATLAPVE